LVAIDVGTTKICVLIAEQLSSQQFEIIGIGKAPSLGLARGVIVDVVAAVQSIRAAIQEAELMAGITVDSAVIGISGGHIQSFNSQGMVAIRSGQITPYDIAQAIAAAKAFPIPDGQYILHALPQFFNIDSALQVRDPLGMHGVRLEVQVHIITGGLSSVQNLVRCCEAAGVKVQDIILEPLASAQAVLSKDEQELGVGVLDIGGGTSDLALYQAGSIRHTKVFPIAGNLFTHDIAVCLRAPVPEAERLKKTFACVLSQPNTKISALNADHDTVQEIDSEDLSAIVEARAYELLLLVHKELHDNKLLSFIPTGLVITGGGSLLQGIAPMAQQVLGIPTRIGKTRVPEHIKSSLQSPIYATGYGLLVYAQSHSKGSILELSQGSITHRIFARMKSWVSDFF
ncbi:MAG TPA: cell division protein FtsA, partial [Candidatus Babeliaceae bacterium]|nr:cell division protein FtsA [Candidatus Babeliaceae bacterium]